MVIVGYGGLGIELLGLMLNDNLEEEIIYARLQPMEEQTTVLGFFGRPISPMFYEVLESLKSDLQPKRGVISDEEWMRAADELTRHAVLSWYTELSGRPWVVGMSDEEFEAQLTDRNNGG